MRQYTPSHEQDKDTDKEDKFPTDDMLGAKISLQRAKFKFQSKKGK